MRCVFRRKISCINEFFGGSYHSPRHFSPPSSNTAMGLGLCSGIKKKKESFRLGLGSETGGGEKTSATK